jgi:hypothetical protein
MNTSGPFAQGSPTWEQAPGLTCGGTGTWKTGEVVTCSPGKINGAPGTATYAWYLDGVTVKGGQTAATYTLVAGDIAHGVTCRVTYTPTDTNFPAGTKSSPLSPLSIA